MPKPPDATATLALVGNMNVGKTTLFNRLCPSKTHSTNFPGSSVTVTRGRLTGSQFELLDTPGSYSVFSQNEDERIARDILLSLDGDRIAGAILVADAKNLKRSIALALEYAEYGTPMLLVLNMCDEAAARGIHINSGKLQHLLGIPVCKTVAPEGLGVADIRNKLTDLRVIDSQLTYPKSVEEFIAIVAKLLQSTARPETLRGMALLLLVGDKSVEKYVATTFGQGMREQLVNLAAQARHQENTPFQLQLTNLYNNQAETFVQQVQQVQPPTKSPFIQKFGEWCTQLSTGIPIALAVVTLMYLVVGSFAATMVVDALNTHLFEALLIPLSQRLVATIPSQMIRDLIMDPDFGVLPNGVFLAFGLVLPVLFFFYIFFGLLEDSGYIPRISFLLDRALRLIGLNGKGVMPLVMGFSCVTMAVLTTRMLDTEKEKNLATFLLMLGFPCAPLLAVMFIILDSMPIAATLTVFGIIILQVLIAGVLANRLLPGKRYPLLLEIPPMRIPNPLAIIKRASVRTYAFIKEAIPYFVLASILVFFFDRLGGLDFSEKLLQPIISGIMGLPENSVQVFIKTMVRRESGATELDHLSAGYTNLQLVVNLLVMTFLMPCINAMIVVFKERGAKAAVLIMASVVIYAITVGGLVNHICLALDISFT